MKLNGSSNLSQRITKGGQKIIFSQPKNRFLMGEVELHGDENKSKRNR